LGGELGLEGENALAFGFNFSGDFLLEFDLSVVREKVVKKR
jgi:hypothetical protein